MTDEGDEEVGQRETEVRHEANLRERSTAELRIVEDKHAHEGPR